MIKFHQLVHSILVAEAKDIDLSAYNTPPPRAKFQAGDFVIVRDSRGKYAAYHSSRYLPYVNKVGRVVSYRNVPGAYSKFALEFIDKNILPIHSQFLDGPFNDLKTALKYQDNVNPIELQDLKGAVVGNNWVIKPGMEREMHKLLTQPPLNFQWYDQPRYTVKDQYTECALAGDGICEFVRTNNTRTKKLYTSTPYHVTVPRIGTASTKYSWNKCNNPLLELPDISVMDILDCVRNKDEIRSLPITYYHGKKLYHCFKQMNEDNYHVTDDIFFNLMHEGLRQENDGWVLDLAQLYYNSWDVFYYNPVLLRHCNIFKNLTIVGGSVGAKVDDGGNLIGSPKIVEGDFHIVSNTTTITDFTGMPVVRGELIGADPIAYKQFQINKAMSSVKNNNDLSKLFKKKNEL